MADRPPACEHVEFAAFVDVARLTDTDGGPVKAFSASVRVDCANCGEPFAWIGQHVGLSPRGSTTSVDGTELRAPLRPRSAPPGWGEDGPQFNLRVRSRG